MRARKVIVGTFVLVTLLCLASLLFVASFSCKATDPAQAFSQSDEVFSIRSSEDLAALAAFNAQESNQNFSYDGKTVLLLADVTAPDKKVFNTFSGVFRGNGFRIDGLRKTFATQIGATGEVCDLVLTGVNVSDAGILASSNFGTIRNLSVHGAVRNGAVVDANYGSVSSVVAFLTVTGGKALIGSGRNSASMSSCYLFADVTVPDGTTTVGPIVNGGESVMTSCAFVGTVTVEGSGNKTLYPLGRATGTKNGLCALYLLDEGSATVSVDGTYDGSAPAHAYLYDVTGDAYDVYDGSGAHSTSIGDLPSSFFYAPASGKPFLKDLFGAEGTSADPFILRDYTDVEKLLFVTKIGFYADLGENISGEGRASLPVSPLGSLIGTVDGNGNVLYKTDFDPFISHASVTDTGLTVLTGFGGDGYDKGSLTAVTPAAVVGSGTQADPYLVRSAEELAGLLSDGLKNVAGAVAYLTRDVLINNSLQGDRTLALLSLPIRLDLDGLGKSVVHAYAAPFGAVYGSLTNCRIAVSPHDSAVSGVCSSVETGGSLSDVIVESSSGTVTSAFCRENRGAISRCFDKTASATYAIAETNAGTATDCASINATAFSLDTTGLTTCTRRGYRVVGGEEREGSDYASLQQDGFDLTLFVYAVGGGATSLETPLLREKGGAYRTLWSASNTVRELSASYANRTYDEDGLPTSEAEDYILMGTTIDPGDYEFTWTYRDGTNVLRPMAEEDGQLYILNVGTYVVTLDVDGDAYIAERVCEQTVTVSKGTFSTGVTFSSYGDLTREYVGAVITEEPTPSNAAELTAAGFTWSYSYALSPGWAAATVKNVGYYRQTLTATAENYTTVKRIRYITVTRKTLSVTVDDQTISYGESLPALTGADVSVDGTVGDDEGKTFTMLATEAGVPAGTYFTCAYDAGDDVGAYEIGYSLAVLGNYALSVTAGTLTVEPAAFSGYVFADDTVEYDGETHGLTATGLPAGTTVTYDPVSATNAGVYAVTATFVNPNYVTATAEATLTIEKKEIVLTASSAQKPYGYEFDASDFSYEHTAVIEGETYEEVTAGVTVTVYMVETGALTAGAYDVKLLVEGTCDNYRFTTTDGVLTVDKTALTTVIPASSFADIEREYSGESIGYAFEEGTFAGYDVVISYLVRKRNEQNPYEGTLTEVGVYYVTATVTPQNATADDFLTTTYTRTVRITLIYPVIAFEESEYAFVYDGTDHASGPFLFTVTKVDEGDVVVRIEKDGVPTESIVRAGTYQVVAQYEGDGNFADAWATATVTVEARAATLTVGAEYTYSRATIEPDLSFAFEGGFAGELTAADLTITYYDRYDYSTGSVISAGTYTLAVSLKNTDYILTPGEYEITVRPRNVTVTAADFEMAYGTMGRYDAPGGTTYFVSDNTVTLKDYYVASTDARTDVTFRLTERDVSGYFPIGTYTVTSAFIAQPNDYRFTFADAFTVSVTRRVLTVSWYDLGIALPAKEAVDVYNGTDQSGRYTYVLSGFAEGENAEAVATRADVSGDSDTIRSVGSYVVTLSLEGNSSYSLEPSSRNLRVQIVKARLTGVIIADGTVMQMEYLPALQVTVQGLRGDDRDVETTRLRGYSCTVRTEYNRLTAIVGQTYTVTGTFAFADYEVPENGVVAGTFTVVEGYPRYTMQSLTTAYDGTPKSLTLGPVVEGITVTYTNNTFTNAGTYDATATLTYPTGRKETLRATLTITRATPTVICPDDYGVFTSEYDLTPSGLGAQAVFGNGDVVYGTYEIVGSPTIRAGSNTVSAKFNPTDSRNFNAVSFRKTIVRYEINSLNTLTYGGSKTYTVDKDGKIHTSAPIEITLNKSGFPEIAADVDMYLNGSVTTKAVLARTATEVLEVRYRERTMFTLELSVVYGENEKEQETVTVDENLLVLDGVQYSEDGGTLYLTTEGGTGTIALSARYADAYALYVNGEPVESAYTVTAKDKRLTVSIRQKELGVALFTRASTVKVGEEKKENEPAVEPEKKSGFKTYYWYIIGGVGGAAALVVVLLLILRRR